MSGLVCYLPYLSVARLRAGGFLLLDAQFTNDHLLQFGIYEISRDQFQQQLATALSQPANLQLERDSSHLVAEMMAARVAENIAGSQLGLQLNRVMS